MIICEDAFVFYLLSCVSLCKLEGFGNNLDGLFSYKRNGILQMLKRNLNVKLAPQRWQDNAADGVFDVVMTFEEKVFDSVLEGSLCVCCYYLYLID